MGTRLDTYQGKGSVCRRASFVLRPGRACGSRGGTARRGKGLRAVATLVEIPVRVHALRVERGRGALGARRGDDAEAGGVRDDAVGEVATAVRQFRATLEEGDVGRVRVGS